MKKKKNIFSHEEKKNIFSHFHNFNLALKLENT